MKATFASQRLIFPEQVTVNPDKAPLLEEILPSLESMGFDMALKRCRRLGEVVLAEGVVGCIGGFRRGGVRGAVVGGRCR